MKAGKIILVILIILVVLIGIRHFRNNNEKTGIENPSGDLIAGDYDFTKEFNGIERVYHVHVPNSYDGSKAVPLVIAFHGGGGEWPSAQKGSGLDATSDDNGFIVVYPTSGKDGNWNVGPRAQSGRESDVDDIAFVNFMLDELENVLNIDEKRIYATGLSNGGMMTYRVACDMSDRIAAVAPVAGSLMNHPCNPSRPISVMAFHGTGDPVVPYYGGPSPETTNKLVRVNDDMRSAEESTTFWRNYDKCNATGKETYSNGDSSCISYSCAENTEVILCTVEGGGHTWPGGYYEVDKGFYRDLVGSITNDIVARDEMWKFFEKHPLP
jgi:polyhydroxybutyrate depolymerase